MSALVCTRELGSRSRDAWTGGTTRAAISSGSSLDPTLGQNYQVTNDGIEGSGVTRYFVHSRSEQCILTSNFMGTNIAPWTKVVTHPLGLAAFALFLVFAFLGSNRRSKRPPWLSPVAFGLAAVALFGGLILAYWANESSGQHPPRQTISSIQQSAIGSANSNVAGVTGDVSVHVSEPSTQTDNGAALTEEAVLALVRTNADDEQVIRTIESRGVSFKLSDDFAERLKHAGASERVLDSIRKHFRP
jgi:hypothetical protein